MLGYEQIGEMVFFTRSYILGEADEGGGGST